MRIFLALVCFCSALWADYPGLWHETFGDPRDDALLMSMGGLCQGILWPDELCEQLAEQGFYVIRYDHRDTGLSPSYDFEEEPYDVLDMAIDAVVLLDWLEVKRAHVVGLSLGGLVGQLMAAHFPDRVATLTLISSSCDFHPCTLALAGLPPEPGHLSNPRPNYIAMMEDFQRNPPATLEEAIAKRVAAWQLLNGSVYSLDREEQWQLQALYLERMANPASLLNHLRAQALSDDLAREAPSQIHAPTLILQGTEDPIFGLDHGGALAAGIANSKLVVVDGMGHVPNPHFFSLWVREIDRLRRDSHPPGFDQ